MRRKQDRNRHALQAIAPRNSALRPQGRGAWLPTGRQTGVRRRLGGQGGPHRGGRRSTCPGRLEDLFQIIQIAFQIFVLGITTIGLADPEEEGRGRCWLAERSGLAERGPRGHRGRDASRWRGGDGRRRRGRRPHEHRERLGSRRCRRDVEAAEGSRFVGGGKQALSIDQPPPDFSHVSRPGCIAEIHQPLQRFGQLGDADLSGFERFVGSETQACGAPPTRSLLKRACMHPPAIRAAKLQLPRLLRRLDFGRLDGPRGNGALKQDLIEADTWPNLGSHQTAVKCCLWMYFKY
jgi:hypothetical protein